jgi:hypothetical protein|tara:strand:+ start:71 stop:304 length:234 start_codon:yes stop_codon:yes gene_type:complete
MRPGKKEKMKPSKRLARNQTIEIPQTPLALSPPLVFKIKTIKIPVNGQHWSLQVRYLIHIAPRHGHVDMCMHMMCML